MIGGKVWMIHPILEFCSTSNPHHKEEVFTAVFTQEGIRVLLVWCETCWLSVVGLVKELALNPSINKDIRTHDPFSWRENPKLRFHTKMNLQMKTVHLSVVFLMILCSPFQFFCGMFPVCLSRLRFKNDDWVTFGNGMKMLALNLVDLSKWFGLEIQLVFHWSSTKVI